MLTKTISIIGCGWLGLPLAERLSQAGYGVKGSATSAEKATVLRQKGIDAYALLLNPDPIGSLATLVQAETLVVAIPPRAGKMGNDFHPRQIQQVVQAIWQSAIQHVIYVSSTSVYPELNRLVVEEDVTSVEQSAAPNLLQAEQLIQSLGPEKRMTIVRCAGLMGYDRIPGKYVAGKTVDSGAVPVNYLHRDDAVGLLFAIIEQGIPGTFNAVAPQHPTREAIYRKSCAEFGYELPTFTEPVRLIPYKIISGEKLVQASQYTFVYPDPLMFHYAL
jgi:nucleoside-diphosphate-sugar epimerase